MGWGHGTNADGREVGYNVEAVCDHPGCTAEIDRGLAYVCGGMHDGGEHGCGGYFCAGHLYLVFRGDDEVMSPQLCEACAAEFERGE